MFIHHKYFPFSPIVPAKTAPAAAITTPMPLEYGHLHGIEVQIPAGHNGLTGVRFTYQGQQIIPWSNLAWLVGSGDRFMFTWDAEIMPYGLAMITYNTDLVPHQFFARADLTPHLGESPHAVAAAQLAGVPSAALVARISALTG